MNEYIPSFIIKNIKNYTIEYNPLGDALKNVEGIIDISGNLIVEKGNINLGVLATTLIDAYNNSKLPNINSIDFGKIKINNKIFNKFSNFLIQCPIHLDRFNLKGSKLNTDNVSILKELITINSIHELNLGESNIKQNLSTLFKDLNCNEIEKLYLYSNEIDEIDSIIITDVILNSKKLKKLNLNNNSLNDEGDIHISDSIAFNNNLESLDLGKNNITSVGIKILMENISLNYSLCHLYLSNNKEIGQIGINSISNYLSANKILQTLDLSSCGITDNMFETLKDGVCRSNISNLNLSYNSITSESISCINKIMVCNSLIVLNLSNNIIIPTVSNPLCLEISKLKKLNLNANSMNDNGAIVIAKHLNGSHINELYLARNEINNVGWEELGNNIPNSELRSINLSYNKVEETSFLVFINKIALSKKIDKLNLSSCDIKKNGAKEISLILKNNFILRKLNLKNNKINELGLIEICNSIKFNNHLKSINLSNQIMSKNVVIALSECIANLHEIYINDCDIKDLGLKLLNSSLLKCNNLFISIEGNKLNGNSVNIIQNILFSNQKINMQISRNSLTPELKWFNTFCSHLGRTSKFKLSNNMVYGSSIKFLFGNNKKSNHPPFQLQIDSNKFAAESFLNSRINELNKNNENLLNRIYLLEKELSIVKSELYITQLIENGAQLLRSNLGLEYVRAIDQLESDLQILISKLSNKEEIANMYNSELNTYSLESVIAKLWDRLESNNENLLLYDSKFNVYTFMIKYSCQMK